MELLASKENIKYISLVTLVAQNTALVLLMRYSRTVEGTLYLASTAVACQEAMKLVTCLAVIFAQKNYKVGSTVTYLYEEIVDKPMDTLKLGIPACLYTMQSNLLYLAISNLDAATFQVTYQLKILTTALFSVAMLGQRLSSAKWVSLLVLMLGVVLVQIPPEAFTDVTQVQGGAVDTGRTGTGLLAVLVACVSSGFAGIYFEKILKGSASSIWLRNVQLGLFGLALALAGVYATNADEVATQGFFQGYTPLVWGVVALNAGGGLVIAVVVKYADNILKGFATSIAIILSSLFSIFFFSFTPSLPFVLGAALVIAAVFIYAKPELKPPIIPQYK